MYSLNLMRIGWSSPAQSRLRDIPQVFEHFLHIAEA